MSEFSQSVWQQVKGGNFDGLKAALESKNPELDLNFQYGGMHESLLHLIVTKGDENLCKLLIERGCNLNTVTRQGVTPLYIACAIDNPSLVELLMKSGANPNTIVPTGLDIGTASLPKDWKEKCRIAPTPLQVAAHCGFTDVVEILLGFGELDASVANSDGNTALHLACASGRLGAARLLAKRIDPTSTLNAAGKAPVDLATNEELKTALTSGGATSGSTSLLKTGAIPASKKEDPKVVLGRCGAEVPEVFGRDMALQLYSDHWKTRLEGLVSLTNIIEHPAGPFASSPISEDTFEASCAVLTDLIHDKHQKVYQQVLRTLHHFFAGPVAKALPISSDDLHPAVELLYIALLKKMESAQARQANARSIETGSDNGRGLTNHKQFNKAQCRLMAGMLVYGSRDGDGRSPILVAALRGDLPVLQQLLNDVINGFAPVETSSSSVKALMYDVSSALVPLLKDWAGVNVLQYCPAQTRRPLEVVLCRLLPPEQMAILRRK